MPFSYESNNKEIWYLYFYFCLLSAILYSSQITCKQKQPVHHSIAFFFTMSICLSPVAIRAKSEK